MQMKSILLVDDHSLFRQAFAIRLDEEPDLEVVRQAGEVAEVRNSGCLKEIDVAVLGLPKGQAAKAIHELREVAPHLAVVAMCPGCEPVHRLPALEAEAEQVLAKSGSLEAIVAAIKAGVRRGVASSQAAEKLPLGAAPLEVLPKAA